MIAIAKNDRNRYGVRAPKGGITIRGRFFRGGCFCWNAPADPATPPAPSAPTRVSIAGFVHLLAPQAIDPSIGTVAFALANTDTGHTYHVHRDTHGEVCCDCADHTLRRAGSGRPCKHGKALIDLGLIPAPTPRTLPTFANRQAPAPAHRWTRFIPSDADYEAAAALMGWRN
jgi:hypothetical protein